MKLFMDAITSSPENSEPNLPDDDDGKEKDKNEEEEEFEGTI
jgi:hypothetical protein